MLRLSGRRHSHPCHQDRQGHEGPMECLLRCRRDSQVILHTLKLSMFLHIKKSSHNSTIFYQQDVPSLRI